jgi:hypothetical protein
MRESLQMDARAKYLGSHVCGRRKIWNIHSWPVHDANMDTELFIFSNSYSLSYAVCAEQVRLYSVG